MSSFYQKNHIIIKIAGFTVFFFVCVFIGYGLLSDEDRLPIYNPNQLNRELVDPSLWDVNAGHTVTDFHLTNQLGQEVSQKNLEDKIYVVNFFFTTCASICPKMTKQMKRVQEKFMDNPDVMIVSHSVTPDIDSVEKMASYGEKHNVNPDKWLLLTGDQDHIFEIARKSYFAVIKGEQGAEKGFVHTENFILIDKEKRIRGYYNGIAKTEVDQMMADIETLMKEYEVED